MSLSNWEEPIESYSDEILEEHLGSDYLVAMIDTSPNDLITYSKEGAGEVDMPNQPTVETGSNESAHKIISQLDELEVQGYRNEEIGEFYVFRGFLEGRKGTRKLVGLMKELDHEECIDYWTNMALEENSTPDLPEEDLELFFNKKIW